MHGQVNQRWVVDATILYTGIDKVTLAANFDFAGEQSSPTSSSRPDGVRFRYTGFAMAGGGCP